MLLKLCNWLANKLPGITISLPDPTSGVKAPYLSRYYFFLKDRKFFNIFLHHFHRSDMDVGLDGFGLLHSHPFKWSFSIVLVAGYSEERKQPDGSVVIKVVRPWSINFLSDKDFHRVDLDNGEAWTIFFTGNRSKSGDWFFWDRVSKEKRHWTTSPNAIA
jgi:hypothetical protein